MDSAQSEDEMQAITKINKYVTRILGQNPSPFTLQGTNTYLVGVRPPFILIDTAQGEPSYIPLLENVLSPFKSSGRPLISDIILTHWHMDHVNGLPSVLKLLQDIDAASKAPRVHKFSPNDKLDEGAISPFKVENLLVLQDNQVFQITGDEDPAESGSSQSQATTLRILHTPGHTKDSISLILQGHGVFTADTVLGQGTAVFEDLGEYMRSLQNLANHFEAETSKNDCALYPGHGPVHATGNALKWVKYYLSHRLDREKSIIEALRSFSRPVTIEETTRKVYEKENLAPNVFRAARGGVLQYFQKLKSEGTIHDDGSQDLETRKFSLTSAKM